MKRCLLSTMMCGLLLADRSCLAAVADKGLVNLKDLKQLVSLDLSATQVTDAGLQHLNPHFPNRSPLFGM